MIALAAACDRLLLRRFARISPCVRAPVQRAWPLICGVVEVPGGAYRARWWQGKNMRALKLRVVALIALGGLALSIDAGAQGLTLAMSVGAVPTGSAGINHGGSIIDVELQNVTAATLTAPFTFTATLPTGLSYGSFSTSGGWTCASLGGVPEQVACTYSINLTTAIRRSKFLNIELDVAPNLDPPSGQVSFRGTAHNAQLPLPPTPQCGPSPSSTACVDWVEPVTPADLRVTAMTAQPQPFVAGRTDGSHQVTVNYQVRGNGIGNAPVVLHVDWPAGISFNRLGAMTVAWTCQSPTAASTDCSTPHMPQNQAGTINLRVDVAANVAVPGPLPVTVSLASNVQTALPDCAASPSQLGCGQVWITTTAAPTALLAITSITHAPARFVVGQVNGPISVHFENRGNAAAVPVHLQVRLPAGFAVGNVLNTTPAFVCSVSGSQPQGQWLVCSRAAGLVAGAVGSIAFEAQVGAGLVSRDLDPVVAALDASAQASASVLLDCASNPQQSHCAWHEIPLQGECRDFVEGLYCDGFEAGATP